MSEDVTKGPLSGVRIVDLTTMLSGPFATMILADQGADVIKVEAPMGDYTRSLGRKNTDLSAMFLNNNRNKRSVKLNLKTKQGMRALNRIISTADVVVENFRPGVAKRLGFGATELLKRDKRLIYVSINGFGDTGPLATLPTYDPIVQALSGIATLQAGSDHTRPKLVRTILADKLTALTAAQAISSALFYRHQHGAGQYVQVSMLDSMLQFLWASDMNAHTFVEDETTEDVVASFIDLIYETQDGHITVSIMTDKQWKGFCDALKCDDLYHDERYRTASLREQFVNERLDSMQEVIQTYTTGALLSKLKKFDIPCAPVLTRSQVYKHPQVIARKSVALITHPKAGRLRQAMPAARFSMQSETLRGFAPELGADTAEVLLESGFSTSEIVSMNQQGVFDAGAGDSE